MTRTSYGGELPALFKVVDGERLLYLDGVGDHRGLFGTFGLMRGVARTFGNDIGVLVDSEGPVFSIDVTTMESAEMDFTAPVTCYVGLWLREREIIGETESRAFAAFRPRVGR